MDFDELKRQFESGQPARVTGNASPSSAHDEFVLEAARAAAGRMRLRRWLAGGRGRRPPSMEPLAPPAGRMRLLAKFSLTFAAVFAVGLAVAAFFLHGMLQRNAREQALHDARLMMETALAMHSYTVDQVKPVIEGTADTGREGGEQAEEAARGPSVRGPVSAGRRPFRPQTVPAFAATEMFTQLRRIYPGYLYKEAALNPTNPRDRAVDWERDVIRAFKIRPEMKVFSGQRDTPLGRSVFLARPMRAHKACLQCHSTPARAPPEMLEAYGTGNGFGWTEGDVVAAQIVSVPVSLPVRTANRTFWRLLLSITLVGLVTLIVLDLLLWVTVISPVSRLARRLDEIGEGRLESPELAVRGRDEISMLAGAYNRMRRSFTDAARPQEGEPEPATRPDVAPRGADPR
jgi:HAMP domain-containing protein